MKKILSVFILTILFFTFLFATITYGLRSDDYIVIVKDDGLYAEHFGFLKNREVKVAEGSLFERPEVSPSGKYIAVTENSMLRIYHMEKQELAFQYEKSLNYYNWDTQRDILYTSSQEGSLVSIDFRKRMVSVRTVTGNKNAIYSNIMPAGEYLYYNKALLENGVNTPNGIWSFHLRTNQEKLLVPAEKKGSHPVLCSSSKDGKYLCLFQLSSKSGENTDGVEMSIYDTAEQKIKQYEKPLITLPYNQNVAPDSDGDMIAVNSGANRYMNFHKTVGIFRVEDGSFSPLIPEDMVSMTPDVSQKSEDVVFSGGKAAGDLRSFEQAGNLQVYCYDQKKRALSKLTEHEGSIQLNPVFLKGGKKIAYIRAFEDRWELWMMNRRGKNQELITGGLKKLNNFYGSYYFYEIIDLHRR